MVKNNIKVRRAEIRISQAALAERMPDDANKISMNFIEAGRCLPTRQGLEALCEIFSCEPTDIYAASELDLLSVGRKLTQAANRAEPETVTRVIASEDKLELDSELIVKTSDRSYEGLEQVRVWFPITEKTALVKVIKDLGYKSVAEWMREMYRDPGIVTVNRDRRRATVCTCRPCRW